MNIRPAYLCYWSFYLKFSVLDILSGMALMEFKHIFQLWFAVPFERSKIRCSPAIM